MRIAFVLNSSGLYGANRSLLGLIRYLREKGVICFALIPENGDVEHEFQKLGVEYSVVDYRSCVWYPGYIGAPFLVNLIKLPSLVKTVKNWNIDLIHSNSTSHDIGIIIAKILDKKHVWHVRENMEGHYHTKNIFPRMYKKLRAQSDATICVSRFIYNYHMEHYPNRNMKMIYNPYDVTYYNIPRESFAPNEVVTILLAGGVLESKRQMDSVKAVGYLIEHEVKNIRLVIAGGGDEKYIDEINRYISEKKLEQYIDMRGFINDLRKLREESDIVLCCSANEALPRVIVEGMLGELLAIGADSGGVAELIEEKKTGLLYEVGNYKQLAGQIEYAIAHKTECRKMILEAKKFAISNFELSHSGEQVLEVYADLLKE